MQAVRRYEFGVEVMLAPSLYEGSKVVVISPRYVLSNQTGVDLEIMQTGSKRLRVRTCFLPSGALPSLGNRLLVAQPLFPAGEDLLAKPSSLTPGRAALPGKQAPRSVAALPWVCQLRHPWVCQLCGPWVCQLCE